MLFLSYHRGAVSICHGQVDMHIRQHLPWTGRYAHNHSVSLPWYPSAVPTIASLTISPGSDHPTACVYPSWWALPECHRNAHAIHRGSPKSAAMCSECSFAHCSFLPCLTCQCIGRLRNLHVHICLSPSRESIGCRLRYPSLWTACPPQLGSHVPTDRSSRVTPGHCTSRKSIRVVPSLTIPTLASWLNFVLGRQGLAGEPPYALYKGGYPACLLAWVLSLLSTVLLDE
jgi:hypothetical protein